LDQRLGFTSDRFRAAQVKLWEQDSEDLILRLESCIRLNDAYQQVAGLMI